MAAHRAAGRSEITPQPSAMHSSRAPVMIAANGTRTVPTTRAEMVAKTTAAAAPNNSWGAPTPDNGRVPAVATVAAAVPARTARRAATVATPASPTPRDSRPAAIRARTAIDPR